MRLPVAGVLSPSEGSVFNDSGYGVKIVDHHVTAGDWINKEISFTTFMAGAEVWGCETRYIRLRALGKTPDVKGEPEVRVAAFAK